MRGSSTNSLVAEFIGDYNYAVATRTYGAAVWNDVRNATDAPAIDAYRQSLVENGSGTPPNLEKDVPATFGNSDIYGRSFFLDPPPLSTLATSLVASQSLGVPEGQLATDSALALAPNFEVFPEIFVTPKGATLGVPASRGRPLDATESGGATERSATNQLAIAGSPGWLQATGATLPLHDSGPAWVRLPPAKAHSHSPPLPSRETHQPRHRGGMALHGNGQSHRHKLEGAGTASSITIRAQVE